MRAAIAFAAGCAIAGLAVPASAQSISPSPDGTTAKAQMGTMRVTALTNSILRVRIAAGGAPAEDASWAVAANIRHQSIPVQPTADGFRTKALAIHIDTSALALTVTDPAGHVIVADMNEALRRQGFGFALHKRMQPGEHYYGLGDKTGPFDRRGGNFVDWNTDAWGFDRGTDPIYKSIPFYIAAAAKAARYGLFLDNSWRAAFDFGHRDETAIEISAADGPIDYYVIAGPSVADVVRRYTDLTGKAPLPPLLGAGLPAVALRLHERGRSAGDRRAGCGPTAFRRTSSGWTSTYQDRNRPFTTNTKTFPTSKGLDRDMGGEGIKLVAITDLHVAHAPDQGYAPYDSGLAGDHFLQECGRQPVRRAGLAGTVRVPGLHAQASRDWWGGLYKDFVADGIAGFWNDMNEPAMFETPTKTMPLDNVHRIESDDFAPRKATHAEVHNVYGMEKAARPTRAAGTAAARTSGRSS